MELSTNDVVLLGVLHTNAKGQSFLSLIGRAGPRALDVDLNIVVCEHDSTLLGRL